MKQLQPFALLLAGALVLAGCDTFDHFQKPPNFSAPGVVSQIPPPSAAEMSIASAQVPPLEPPPQGSLWRRGSKAFFRDPRALGVGDLLTVAVRLQEQAEFANQTNLQRTTGNTMAVNSLAGAGSLLARAFPGLASSNTSIDTSGSGNTQGQGDIKRSENILMNVAATIVRVMPNRNLEIAGSQEIRLNNELRQLQIRGIVRPEDIRSDNTIPSEKIADARIAYGGRGVSSDIQRPAWGQDVLTRVQPF